MNTHQKIWHHVFLGATKLNFIKSIFCLLAVFFSVSALAEESSSAGDYIKYTVRDPVEGFSLLGGNVLPEIDDQDRPVARFIGVFRRQSSKSSRVNAPQEKDVVADEHWIIDEAASNTDTQKIKILSGDSFDVRHVIAGETAILKITFKNDKGETASQEIEVYFSDAAMKKWQDDQRMQAGSCRGFYDLATGDYKNALHELNMGFGVDTTYVNLKSTGLQTYDEALLGVFIHGRCNFGGRIKKWDFSGRARGAFLPLYNNYSSGLSFIRLESYFGRELSQEKISGKFFLRAGFHYSTSIGPLDVPSYKHTAGPQVKFSYERTLGEAELLSTYARFAFIVSGFSILNPSHSNEWGLGASYNLPLLKEQQTSLELGVEYLKTSLDFSNRIVLSQEALFRASYRFE